MILNHGLMFKSYDKRHFIMLNHGLMFKSYDKRHFVIIIEII